MGRLTNDELENLYRLQMDVNSVAVFNVLVKSNINEYSKVLAKNIIISISDYMNKVEIMYNDDRAKAFNTLSRDLCFFGYDSETALFEIKHVVVDYYNGETYLSFRAWPKLLNKIRHIKIYERLRRKRSNLQNIINSQGINNPKFYKYLLSYVRSLLYLTIHNKLN